MKKVIVYIFQTTTILDGMIGVALLIQYLKTLVALEPSAGLLFCGSLLMISGIGCFMVSEILYEAYRPERKERRR